MQVTIQIPEETDARAVVANMKAGVLEVTLPKPSGRGRSIKVDEAKSQSRGFVTYHRCNARFLKPKGRS